MPIVSLRLPNSLHTRVRQIAEQDGTSVNQFIATAVAEKLSSLDTVEYLRGRAKAVDISDFDRILDEVLSTTPDTHDRFPNSPST